MNILFFTHLTSEFSQFLTPLQSSYPEHRFILALSKEEYKENLKEAHILIYGNPSDTDVETAVNLKLIIVPYAGVTQLNFPLLQSLGIKVANSHGNATIVGEKALALAMALCGRIVEFHNDLKQGNWHRTGDHHKPFDYWFSMIGKKISILGTGAIGSAIAELLQGFNCEIKGFRKRSEIIPDFFHSVSSNLDEVLDFGQVIFLALPMTEETRGIISEKNIGLISGKFVINVGRGGLIEETPFFKALEDKTIRGAGLDAWYDYPSKENPNCTGSSLPFSELSNVVISPHAASHTTEGKMGQLIGAIEVLNTYCQQDKVLNEILGEY